MYKTTIGVSMFMILAVARAQANPVVIADSVAEFSGVQGQNNWYYGYWDRTHDSDGVYQPDNFQQMTHFLTGPSTWYVQPGSYWTSLWADGGHPNGTNGNGNMLPFEHWSTRRWVSEVSGTIEIAGQLAAMYGSNAVGRIRIDGVEVWSQFVPWASPGDYAISASVQQGSFVDFMIDPYQANDVNDGIRFTATVTPEPAALALFGCGALVMLRRSRRRGTGRSTALTARTQQGSSAFGMVLVLTLIGASQAYAGVWTQWSGNGHYYMPVAVPGGINWDVAQAQAVAENGYLATITSAAENDFVFSLVDEPQYWNMASYTMGPWLGGYQPQGSPEPYGGWTWVTGEPWSFTNWYAGEPNDNPSENYLHFSGGWGGGRSSYWNDATINGTGRAVVGYVVESTVPEPSSLVFLAGGLLLAVRRRGLVAR